jgi:hypothetical protein
VNTNKHIQNVKNKYFCNICKYGSSKKTDYNKHLTTKKHLKKSQTTEDIKNKVDNTNIEIIIKQNNILMDEMQKLKDTNEKLKDSNNKNTNTIVKEARTIKKSILTLLNTHFKDTPSIEYIKKEEFYKELEEEYKEKIYDGTDKIFLLIFQDYKKKKLIKTMSDLILKFVKKDNQKFQSVFNIDTARSNFATKINDFWMNDKKGIQLRKFTVDKVVSYMIEILEIFRLRLVKVRDENIRRSTSQRSDYLMINQMILFEVVSFLTNSNTHTKIVILLSPNLRCDDRLLHLC